MTFLAFISDIIKKQMLFDKNKNKIHTYELEGTSAEAF